MCFCLRDLRTTNAQTSLRVRAVWSVPLLFAFRKVSYLNMHKMKIFNFLARRLVESPYSEDGFCRVDALITSALFLQVPVTNLNLAFEYSQLKINVSASSQSLRFILSLRMNPRFIYHLEAWTPIQIRHHRTRRPIRVSTVCLQNVL